LKRALVLLLASLAVGCTGRHAAENVQPRYVVGDPYQTGGVWRYPAEHFEYEETGLATVVGRHPALTANGEAFSPSAMAAGHRTLQLPAIAQVTNLDTGRQVLVRINDRGPANPGRLIELTPRAAELLGATSGASFPVRVKVLEAESRQLAAALQETTPKLALAAAPAGDVTTETLAPPPGASQSAHVRKAAPAPQPRNLELPAAAAVPLRLPETVTQVPPRPGNLFVDAGRFGRLEYANILRARLASLGAQTTTSYDAPRDRAYQVRIGPFRDAAAADAMLDRTLRAGVSDARIIVE
jgi:rare lipoprotein A